MRNKLRRIGEDIGGVRVTEQTREAKQTTMNAKGGKRKGISFQSERKGSTQEVIVQKCRVVFGAAELRDGEHAQT